MLVDMRSEKIEHYTAPEKAALINWTKARLQIRGFQAIGLFKDGVPIRYLCWFRHGDIIRMRDLFIRKEHRDHGLSKHLLCHVMANYDGPFAVVTSSDNPARWGYLVRGLEPVFVQEAYELTGFARRRDPVRCHS